MSENEKETSPYDKEHIYSKVTVPVRLLDIIIIGGVVALLLLLVWMEL